MKSSLLISKTLISLSLLSCTMGSSALANAESDEVASLKAQMQEMMKRLNELESKQNSKPATKKASAHKSNISHTKAESEPAATVKHTVEKTDSKAKPAEITVPPKVVASRNEKVKLSIYGHVNRALAFYDNGYNSELRHVDPNASATRVTFAAEAKLNNNFKAGASLELQFVSESSSLVDIGMPNNSSNTSNGAINASFSAGERLLDVYFETCLGNLYAGQGYMSTYKLMDLDMTGTTVIQEGLELQSVAGGIRFATGKGGYLDISPAGAATRFRNVADVYNEILDSKRLDRVRYDTPAFYGFTLTGSHSVRDKSDFALKYAGEVNGVKLAAAVGTYNDPFFGTPWIKVRKWGGSFATLFPIGISINAGYGEQNYKQVGRKDGRTWGVKLGYQHDFFDVGKTCFAVAYGDARRVSKEANISIANSTKSKVWGVHMVQNIDKVGTELFVSWQNHDLKDNSGNNYRKINSVLTGARLKF